MVLDSCCWFTLSILVRTLSVVTIVRPTTPTRGQLVLSREVIYSQAESRRASTYRCNRCPWCFTLQTVASAQTLSCLCQKRERPFIEPVVHPPLRLRRPWSFHHS